MSILHGSLAGIIAGGNLDVTRDITDIPSGQLLTKAWLTFKQNPSDADASLLQKVITPTAVPDIGQITNTGGSGTGSVTFQLTAANTTALPTGRYVPYEIKVLTDAGKLYVAEQGYYFATPGLTAATS